MRQAWRRAVMLALFAGLSVPVQASSAQAGSVQAGSSHDSRAEARPAGDSVGSLMGPALFVTDLARSRRFYVDGIGMMVGAQFGSPEKYETILTFDPKGRGGVIILLTDRTATRQAPVQHGHGYDRTVLRIADVAGTAAQLKAAGFDPGPVHEAGAGGRVLHMTDPDGYGLELVQTGTSAPATGGER